MVFYEQKIVSHLFVQDCKTVILVLSTHFFYSCSLFLLFSPPCLPLPSSLLQLGLFYHLSIYIIYIIYIKNYYLFIHETEWNNEQKTNVKGGEGKRGEREEKGEAIAAKSRQKLRTFL